MQKLHDFCSVDDCGRKHKARGYCASHYAQFLRGETPSQPLKARDRSPPETCSIEGCTEPPKAKGLCQMHYARKLRHGFVKNPDRTKPRVPCSVIGCNNYSYTKGLCNAHYLQVRKFKWYGISVEEYESMLSAQNGLCKICFRPEMSKDSRSGKVKAIAIDHCHDTGKVRGLLCSNCNRAIGLMNHDEKILTRAIEYLRETS